MSLTDSWRGETCDCILPAVSSPWSVSAFSCSARNASSCASISSAFPAADPEAAMTASLSLWWPSSKNPKRSDKTLSSAATAAAAARSFFNHGLSAKKPSKRAAVLPCSASMRSSWPSSTARRGASASVRCWCAGYVAAVGPPPLGAEIVSTSARIDETGIASISSRIEETFHPSNICCWTPSIRFNCSLPTASKTCCCPASILYNLSWMAAASALVAAAEAANSEALATCSNCNCPCAI